MLLAFEILPCGSALVERVDPATGDVTTETIVGYADGLDWPEPAPDRTEPITGEVPF